MPKYLFDKDAVKKIEGVIEDYHSMIPEELKSVEDRNTSIIKLNDLEKTLFNIEKLLLKNNNELLKIITQKNNNQKKYESIISRKSYDDAKAEKIMLKIKECSKKEKDIDKNIETLKELKSKFRNERDQIAHRVGGKRFLDKEIILNNVKRIAKEKGIRIRDIENDSGNSIGYMARLSKADSLALPNIDFVITAIKLLDVPIEEVLYRASKPYNSNERIINSFIRKIYKQSLNKSLDWKKTPKERFLGYGGSKNKTDFPLADIDVGEYIDSYGDLSSGLIEEYKSLFLESGYVDLVGDIANTSFDDDGNKIYISPVKYRKDREKSSERVIYEVYITDKNNKNVKALCNTENINRDIENAIATLYKEAVSKSTSINVDKDTEEILTRFLDD